MLSMDANHHKIRERSNDRDVNDDDGESFVESDSSDDEEYHDPDSDDDQACPICLNDFDEQKVGLPNNCQHVFCVDCILEWSKNANSCPVDRIEFQSIRVYHHFGGIFIHELAVQGKACESAENEILTCCEICGRGDNEDTLLLCDGCDRGFHCSCLQQPLDAVPAGEWFCDECQSTQNSVPDNSNLRLVGRTNLSERVRNRITRTRMRYADTNTTLDEQLDAIVSYILSNAGQRLRVKTPPIQKSRSASRKRSKRSRRKKRQKRRKTRRGRAKEMSQSKAGLLGKEFETSHSLSLTGVADELDEFSSSFMKPESEPSYVIAQRHRLLSQSAIRFNKPLPSLLPCGNKPSKALSPPPPVPDVLSSIFDGQNLLFASSENVSIKRGGNLVLKEDIKSKQESSKTAKSSCEELHHKSKETKAKSTDAGTMESNKTLNLSSLSNSNVTELENEKSSIAPIRFKKFSRKVKSEFSSDVKSSTNDKPLDSATSAEVTVLQMSDTHDGHLILKNYVKEVEPENEVSNGSVSVRLKNASPDEFLSEEHIRNRSQSRESSKLQKRSRSSSQQRLPSYSSSRRRRRSRSSSQDKSPNKQHKSSSRSNHVKPSSSKTHKDKDYYTSSSRKCRQRSRSRTPSQPRKHLKRSRSRSQHRSSQTKPSKKRSRSNSRERHSQSKRQSKDRINQQDKSKEKVSEYKEQFETSKRENKSKKTRSHFYIDDDLVLSSHLPDQPKSLSVNDNNASDEQFLGSNKLKDKPKKKRRAKSSDEEAFESKESIVNDKKKKDRTCEKSSKHKETVDNTNNKELDKIIVKPSKKHIKTLSKKDGSESDSAQNSKKKKHSKHSFDEAGLSNSGDLCIEPELYSPSCPMSPFSSNANDLPHLPPKKSDATNSAAGAVSLFSKLLDVKKTSDEQNVQNIDLTRQDGEKEKKSDNVLNSTQILNIVDLNPQQQSAAKEILTTEDNLKKSKHCHKEDDCLSSVNIDNIESSSVALYNRDKKKIQQKKKEFQDSVIAAAKTAIKPHYERREVNKAQYKDIMKRAVNKICKTDKMMEVNVVKIRRLIRRYVECYQQKE